MNLRQHPLAREKISLATQHGKQAALAPAFASFAVELDTPVGIDTDSLGTFSGEIPRLHPPLETAIAKARLAMTATGARYGLATEGSFSPDPILGVVSIHHELAVLVDDVHDQFVFETLTTHDTNYASIVIASGAILDTAAIERWGFPEHAVLVRANDFRAGQNVFKGLRSRAAIDSAISTCAAQSSDGLARVETDMRAHMNPTRMRQIAHLGARLTQRLLRLCSACGAPGFGRVDRLAGLPCALCGSPTNAVLSEIHGCGACHHRERQPRADGRTQADPAECDYCNP